MVLYDVGITYTVEFIPYNLYGISGERLAKPIFETVELHSQFPSVVKVFNLMGKLRIHSLMSSICLSQNYSFIL